jgi:hypothetical protein
MTLAALLAAVCLFAAVTPFAHTLSHSGSMHHQQNDPCEFCLAVLSVHALLRYLCAVMFITAHLLAIGMRYSSVRHTGQARVTFTLVSLKVRLNP